MLETLKTWWANIVAFLTKKFWFGLPVWGWLLLPILLIVGVYYFFFGNKNKKSKSFK